MIYLEPAPYIVGFVREVRKSYEGQVDVFYVNRSLTQSWGYWAPESGEEVLPKNIFAAAGLIWRRVNPTNYRLLHLAGWGHPLLATILCMAMMRNIPVVMESDTPFGQISSPWKRVIKRFLYPLLFRIPKQFLPGGTRQAKYLQYFGVEDQRIHIAHMTVDVEAISVYTRRLTAEQKNGFRHNNNIPNEGVCILYVGRLEPHKGLFDLFEAFVSLQAEKKDVHLLIAGSGSLQNIVEDKVQENPFFHYLGHLKDKQVWDAYSIADIFILPSLFEPWGLVVNEAMAAGLPVIVTDGTGCVDDLVLDGVTGIIIPAANPRALATALRHMVDNTEMRQTMGMAGSRIISGWTQQAAAENTIHTWYKVIQ